MPEKMGESAEMGDARVLRAADQDFGMMPTRSVAAMSAG